MDIYDPEAWKPGQPDRPRRALMRAGLEEARKACDVGLTLCALAQSYRFG